MNHTVRSWVEIQLSELQENLQKLRGLIGPDCLLMQVVKADAYGHGLQACGKYASPYVDWFAVTTVAEGAALREAGCQNPILVFEALTDADVLPAVKLNLTINFCSLEYCRRVNALLEGTGCRLDGHIEVDTGMNRTGLKMRADRVEQVTTEAAEICRLPNLRVTGCYTHFACPDSPDEQARRFTRAQWVLYQQFCGEMEQAGYSLGLHHCCSSTALLNYPEYRMDMVRTGMFPLGQCDCAETAQKLGIHQIMRWYARVVDIQTVRAGEPIGYNCTYIAQKDTRIANISVGYADGYNRAYSNRAQVIIRGKYAAVCGKVCMDCFMVDVTEIPECRAGDLVLLLGESENKCIRADELAALIPFGVSGAVTCAIAARVPRHYTVDCKMKLDT